MTELILFLSTFATVFALGFQSLNVNGGHYVSAFFTSFIIAAGNFALLKYVPGDTTTLQNVAFFSGGPFGIVASMFVHRRTVGKRRRSRGGNINCGADRL
jgi:hypothetical protein